MDDEDFDYDQELSVVGSDQVSTTDVFQMAQKSARDKRDKQAIERDEEEKERMKLSAGQEGMYMLPSYRGRGKIGKQLSAEELRLYFPSYKKGQVLKFLELFYSSQDSIMENYKLPAKHRHIKDLKVIVDYQVDIDISSIKENTPTAVIKQNLSLSPHMLTHIGSTLIKPSDTIVASENGIEGDPKHHSEVSESAIVSATTDLTNSKEAVYRTIFRNLIRDEAINSALSSHLEDNWEDRVTIDDPEPASSGLVIDYGPSGMKLKLNLLGSNPYEASIPASDVASGMKEELQSDGKIQSPASIDAMGINNNEIESKTLQVSAIIDKAMGNGNNPSDMEHLFESDSDQERESLGANSQGKNPEVVITPEVVVPEKPKRGRKRMARDEFGKIIYPNRPPSTIPIKPKRVHTKRIKLVNNVAHNTAYFANPSGTVAINPSSAEIITNPIPLNQQSLFTTNEIILPNISYTTEIPPINTILLTMDFDLILDAMDGIQTSEAKKSSCNNIGNIYNIVNSLKDPIVDPNVNIKRDSPSDSFFGVVKYIYALEQERRSQILHSEGNPIDQDDNMTIVSGAEEADEEGADIELEEDDVLVDNTVSIGLGSQEYSSLSNIPSSQHASRFSANNMDISTALLNNFNPYLPASNLSLKEITERRKDYDRIVRKKKVSWLKNATNFHNNQIANQPSHDMFFLSSENSSLLMEHQTQKKLNTEIIHSIPAYRLSDPYFRLHLPVDRLRHWHRPRFSNIDLNKNFPIDNLIKHMAKKQKEHAREKENGGANFAFEFRNGRSLSSRDGDVVLMEYSEEYPPVLSNVGMASRIVNYYCRQSIERIPKFEYGQIVIYNKQEKQADFLGQIRPGDYLQSMQNNLYKAPIYKQYPAPTDFLIVRSKNKFFIRTINNMYTVGQLLPKMVVPVPGSRQVNQITSDRLETYIFRLFKQKGANSRVKTDEIAKVFPKHSEGSLRKKLKMFAEFRRNGPDSGNWVLKDKKKIPDEESLRTMFPPEKICLFEAMLAGQQRLRDQGLILKKQDLDLEGSDDESMVDEGGSGTLGTHRKARHIDEMRLAPWNTTRNFLDAASKRCMMKIEGYGDPTKDSTGFSYLRMSNKSYHPRLENGASGSALMKKKITPESDLRKLPMKEVFEILKNQFGIPEESIPAGRWEKVDMLRQLSNQAVLEGEESAYARGIKITSNDQLKEYQERCQYAFDRQNCVLSITNHPERLQLDLYKSGLGLSNINPMTSLLANVSNNTSTSYMNMHGSIINSTKSSASGNKMMMMSMMGSQYDEDEDVNMDMDLDNDQINSKQQLVLPSTHSLDQLSHDLETDLKKKPCLTIKENTVLKITRIYKDSNGKRNKKFVFISDPDLIEQYIIKKTTRTKAPAVKKADKAGTGLVRGTTEALEEFLKKSNICGSSKIYSSNEGIILQTQNKGCTRCGDPNHANNNKICPLYSQEEHRGRPKHDTQKMTKISLNKDMLVDAGVFNEELEVSRGNAYSATVSGAYTGTKRKRRSPIIDLTNIFKKAITVMMHCPGADLFRVKVDKKLFRDYYQKVKAPMHFKLMKKKIDDKKYRTHLDFLKDVNQLAVNSEIYNGPEHAVTLAAKAIHGIIERYFSTIPDLKFIEKEAEKEGLFEVSYRVFI